MKNVICRVPQRLIFCSLLFLIFRNDFWHSTPILEVNMYADDANLFYSQNDTRELFRAVNAELKNLISGFIPANYC